MILIQDICFATAFTPFFVGMKLNEFITNGGRLEFGNLEHIKMLKESITSKYRRINIGFGEIFSYMCSYCGHESNELREDDDYDLYITEVFIKVDIPDELVDTSLDSPSREFFKCKRCKKISYL